jgi:hypothetical protein
MALSARSNAVPTIMGAIPAQEVRLKVESYKKEMQLCHTQAKLEKGILTVEFTILGEDGKVKDVKINEMESDFKRPSFFTCMKRVVKGMKFDKITKGRNTLARFPFRFPLK